MDVTSKLKEIIKESHNLVVFTGAGISVPSGIPDFRSAHGIYNEKFNATYRPEEIISHSFFVRHTDEFYQFYKSKMMYLDAKPNLAHLFFAQLEEKSNKNISVVTQNIDGLHQQAGNKKVYELHGSIYRNYCMNCRKFYDAKYVKNFYHDTPTCQDCGGIIKPDVVLYEEGLDEDTIMRSIDAIRRADTMIVIGTSLVVYPAASFVRYFNGKHLVLINKSATPYDSMADLVINDDVVNVIKKMDYFNTGS